MAAPELIADAVEEILLRVPPDEPAHLLRASLVCKPWRRILTDPAFLRRYREFHGTPPLLGFIDNLFLAGRDTTPRFVPTTAAYPFPQLGHGCRSSWALDCRHGRVLLQMGYRHDDEDLLVWDPATGRRRGMRRPGSHCWGFSAAVLCAVAGCDHLDCHGGPFLVVFVGTSVDQESTSASVYSSETGAWSTATSVANGGRCSVEPKRGALVGDGIYFTLTARCILKCDLGDHGLSFIDWPDTPVLFGSRVVPMQMEDGSLGLAAVRVPSLYLWSRNADPRGVATWVLRRVIDLETMLPICIPYNYKRPDVNVIGFAEGVGIIFVTSDVGVFTVDLRSGSMRKVSEPVKCYSVIPFMSFYTPDRAGNKLSLPAETS